MRPGVLECVDQDIIRRSVRTISGKYSNNACSLSPAAPICVNINNTQDTGDRTISCLVSRMINHIITQAGRPGDEVEVEINKCSS